VNLQALGSGQSVVYVATRLFDHSSRFYGALIERASHDALRRVLERHGIQPTGPLTFLPFRDSNEAARKRPGESLTEAIFRIDCERLDAAAALIAPFHGINQDIGIAFEIGYCAARHIPILAIASDFVRLSHSREEEDSLVEPLLASLCTQVVDASAFLDAGAPPTREGYLSRLHTTFAHVESLVGQAVAALAEGSTRPASPPPSPEAIPGRVHLEFGGGLQEYQRLLAARAEELLTRQGFSVTVSERYSRGHGSGAALAADLAAVKRCQLLITLGDGPDMDAEIAAMQGHARALGRRVVLYLTTSRALTTGPEYHTPRNLMLLHSADRIASSLDGILPAVVELAAG
jgi:nucleoside 2-deoxyribosyltransferase